MQHIVELTNENMIASVKQKEASIFLFLFLFQIVFEAHDGGSSYCDIYIDNVDLVDCPAQGELHAVMETFFEQDREVIV